MALTPATMAEALWIGPDGGQNHYNVGIGQGTTNQPNAHTDFTQAQIVAGYTDANFFLNASFNPVFRIGAGAGTTSTNTVHPRSELRELLADGVNKASWDGRTGMHYMQGRSRIIEVTDRRPWICFFQVHGSDISPNTSDLARIQTEGTNGTTTNLSIVCRYSPPSSPNSETRVVLKTGYNVNDWVSWRIQIGGPTSADNGRLRIFLDGVEVLNVASMGQVGCYFKTGCYLQDSVSEGASAGTFGAVEMEKGSLETWHTGYPSPTVPVFTGPDDGLGAGTDSVAPTVPGDLAGIRGDTTAQLVWDASTDNVGVDHYVVRRSSVEDAGSSTTTANLGKTDDGSGSSTSSANKTVVSTFTAGTTGTVTAGHARLWVDTGSASIKMCVYAVDGVGEPAALLGLSDALTVSGTSEADRTFTFTGVQQAAITAGIDYWIGFTWADPGSNNISWSRGTTSGVSRQNSSNSANPFGTPGAALSGPIDAYVVVSTTTSTDGSVDIAHPTTTTYTDTGRTNGVAYSYTVSAVDAAANESAQSDSVTVTPGPPDVTAPTVPGNPVAVSGDRQATLSWDASTDADTGVRKYRVYMDTVLIGSTTGLFYTFTELENGRTYALTVSAQDNSLNESAQTSPTNATPTAPSVAGVPFLERELGRGAQLGVEVAFGADLATDPDTWDWTDVTTDVRQDPGISTSLGRNDESGTSNPAELALVLTNTDGDYSLGGRSRWWPYVRRGTPVRLRIDPADGGGGRVVFWGEATGWTPGWQDGPRGRVAVVALAASGTLRRLSQGDAPVKSSYRRTAPVGPYVVAYWPMEEEKAATYAPAVRGGADMKVEGEAEWAADTSFFCSAPLPQLKKARLTAFPAPYADTGQVQARFLMLMPDSATAVPAGTYIVSMFLTGTISRWDIIYNGAEIALNFYLASGALHSTSRVGFDFTGVQRRPARLSLQLQQSGGNIAWSFHWAPAEPRADGLVTDGTLTGHTLGAVSWIQFGANQQLGDTAIGHLTVENAVTNQFTDNPALSAYQGEAPMGPAVIVSGEEPAFTSRIERLCAENGVALTSYPSTLTGGAAATDRAVIYEFDGMGPQLVTTLLALLHEAEAADQGQLWDGRGHGLAYTSRRRREQGALRLTVDAVAGELGADFAPTDDDQRTRNRVAVKRTVGVTTEDEDADGPLGTGQIGIYDEQVTVNLHRDQDTAQHAQWRVAQGTFEGYRYPSVSVDLRRSPELAGDVLSIVPGERIDVTGLDDTLAEFTAETVSLIVEGIAHEITATSWQCTFRCSPFDPWAVGRVAAESGDTSDMLMRLDTDGSQTAARAEKGFTTLSVTSSPSLWTTAADDYPLWLEVDGLPVRATACTGASNPQTFTIDPLQVPRAVGAQVQLWRPRVLGMGQSVAATT
jgi:hypothetical protein